MIDLGFWKRSGALLSLLAHFSLVGAGPLVDAYLDLAGIEASAAGMHVEDESLPPCLKHDHATCIVCRSLQNMAAGVDGDVVSRIAEQVTLSLGPALASVRSIPWLSSVSPRAPPASPYL